MAGADHPPESDPRAEYDYVRDTDGESALVSDLRDLVDGDVRFDEYTRTLYATDASIYEVTPIGVVFPRSTADVAAVLRYCADREIPTLPRGGGTSLAGQAVNEAVVLDLSRHMNRVLDIDPDGRVATAEAGVTLADLNAALDPHDLKFAPDPSTANRSALGGAIGNNTTGAHSLQYGKTDAYIEEVTAVLADGTVTTFGETTIDDLRERADPSGGLEARIAAEVVRLVDEEADAIDEAFPDLKRNVSGYNLDVLIEEATGERGEPGVVNLARLLVGSEGTLATVTEATVSLEPIPPTEAVAVLTYRDLHDAMADVAAVLDHDPAAVEVMDDVLLDLARDTEEFADVVGILPDGTDAFLLVEFYADSDEERRERVQTLIADRTGPDALAFDALAAYDETDRDRLWEMRKASTPILLGRTTDEKHIAFVEDVAVPPDRLPEYVADFRAMLADHDTFGSFYAHAGPGCIHIRPLVDTKTADGVERMESIAADAADLAVAYGGSVSGEHGDGRARTQWNRRLYGEHVWGLFGDLKTAFDPDWLLNPGTVCGDHDMTEHLRYGPDYEFDADFEPGLHWPNENGFQGMVELCHGCAGCRGDQHTTGGVMCPTYRASREEITSTRGRANLLRRAMSGGLPDGEAFDVEFAHEVLDLCVGCKGCARDCPSEVDLAKLKAEVTHERHRRHGIDRRTRLFANVDRLSKWGSRLAPLSNWAASLPGAGLVAERLFGIARERSPPTFHRETLRDWVDARGGAAVPEAEADHRVVLFPDTHTNYSDPDAGRAAVGVLEAAGVHVAIPDGLAPSGRAAYSTGMLDVARDRARTNVEALAPWVRDGWSVVFVEPSDAVMFQSDYRDLLGGADAPPIEDVDAVAASSYGVCEYLDVHRLDEALPTAASEESLSYHGHCHQKATTKDHHAVAVLRRAGYAVDPVDSTCCGMAGSFGYETEHYSMSQAIGRILFSQLRESDGDTVTAPGASCRTQIGDEFGGTPPHPIEKLADALSVTRGR